MPGGEMPTPDSRVFRKEYSNDSKIERDLNNWFAEGWEPISVDYIDMVDVRVMLRRRSIKSV